MGGVHFAMNIKTFGQIANGVCVNVVVADDAWIALQNGVWIESTDSNIAWIGATVSNGLFSLIPTIDESERV
jgi:hypothetical protein